MSEQRLTPVDSTFLGRGWAFPPAFDARTHGALMVDEAQDVGESLRILLFTRPGERVMHPGYGCGLNDLVFEPLTESLMTEMRSVIEKAVLFFEARVALQSVEFVLDDIAEGRLLIQLDYSIRTTNTRHNLVFPLYLMEGRSARGEGP